ncbi:MAG: hypothetical protein WAO91_01805 [Candidatus Nitrosotenuis sp.]
MTLANDRLTKETVQRLQEMVFHNEHIKKSSLATKILVLLYPNKTRNIQEIEDDLRLKGICQKGTMSNLLERKLISSKGSGGARLYFLTQKGRWFAVCHELNLSFLGLCALADAYGMQGRLEEGSLVGFYVYPRFAEIFEGIYSQENLRFAFGQLKAKKLATRYSKKSLRIIPRVFSDLKRHYHQDLEELQKWIAQIPARKEEILGQDQKFIQDISKSKRILSRFS